MGVISERPSGGSAVSAHYGTYQSEEAIRHAGEILAFVRARMAGQT